MKLRTKLNGGEDASIREQLPNFLIIGAMRSGTTSLANYLGSHPEIYVARDKELHFFDYRFDRGLSWYAAKFSQAKRGQAVGEASPTYMYVPECARRIADTLPNVKLLAILRNPVDRAYSHYWLERARTRESMDFESALAAESDRLSGSDRHRTDHYSYLDRGRYLKQLEHVTTHVPRERLHVLLFEDLGADPAAAFKSVCRFLDVDDTYIPKNVGKVLNHFVTFRSVAVRGMYRRLPPLIRHALGRVNSREAVYPAMDPRTRARLVAHFAQMNDELGRWLGRDLAAWNR